jgi:predicted MFS family arabinose efflux permease
MLSSYRLVYQRPGTLDFSLAGFVSRFSIAVYPLGVVLIVSGRLGNYGFAGVVSGCVVVGEAVGNPIGGALVDRYAQRAVILPFLAAHVAAVLIFGTLTSVRAPLWMLIAPALVVGASLLNVGALIRARWSLVWADDASRRSSAYSIESVLDEIIFVLGPLVASVLATHAPAPLTLGVAVGLVVVGSLRLASLRDTDPPARVKRAGERRVFALAYPGMGLAAAIMVCIGGVFGSAEVTFVAFCGQHGSRADSGLVLASFAGGSALGGIVYGAVTFTARVRLRLFLTTAGFAVLTTLFYFAGSIAVLAAFAAVAGLAIAPTLIGGFSLVDETVPATALTEGLTWIGTGLSVGYGLGASIVGGIADARGARSAFLIPTASATAAAALALVLLLRDDRRFAAA